MLDIERKDQFPSSFGRLPWLIKFPDEEKETCTFINFTNGSKEERNIPEMKGKKCFGCFGEWVLLIDKETRECFFLSLVSYSKVHLPPFKESIVCIEKFSLSSSPTSPDCIITYASFNGDFILFCHKHDKEWTKLLVPYYHDQYPHGCSGVNVIYNGWLLILSKCRLAKIFDFAALCDHKRVEVIPSYALDDYSETYKMDKYFVESCNSLYLVIIHKFGLGQHVIHMEVHQLVEPSEESEIQDRLYWNYVPNIGDQAFFLSRYNGVSLCAKEFGVEPNCIYATVPCFDGERLYKFCLDNQTFSFDLLLPEDRWNFEGPLFWAIPTSRMQAIEFETPLDVVESNKDRVIIEENQERNQILRQWTDLPIEMVELLFQRLSLVDCLRVSTLCKAWASTSQSIPEENAWPWLMHSPDVFNGKCKFFDPVCGKEYSLEMDVLFTNQQIAFHSSRDGWVVMSEGDEAIYVLNPLTKEMIELPGLDCPCYNCISFTGVPTSPDFRAFAFYFEYDDNDKMVKIYSYRPGQKELTETGQEELTETGQEEWTETGQDELTETGQEEFTETGQEELTETDQEEELTETGQEEWAETILESDIQFCGTINNPVFFHGEFYCLDRRGQLGVFNPEVVTWRVLTKPEPICSDVPCYAYACCSLVEIQGDLIAVFRPDTPLKPIEVYKLDRSKMAWSEVDNLGDITIFVGFRNSIAVPSPLKRFRNSIYFPKFDDREHRNGVFYSMDDHQYHPRFYGVEQPTTYVWFQPSKLLLQKDMDAETSSLQDESSLKTLN
ncbi:F-box protein family-like [Rhynchospora pubera]|uniref:F-box protein family-like n=1 Tax=Rhynchospora pubera TaxID=906938 RepID=A0AAV8FZ25_9POAL|nr:F-box protein family-like [Rhynchospora pubera]